MIIELSLMSATLLVMIGLLAHKTFESARGAHASVSSVREKTDPILQNIHHTTGKYFSYITLHNTILLVNYLFVHTVRLFMHTSQKVHKVSSEIVHKASQKTEDLSRGGAASFYLKKIKEEKEKNGGMAHEAK